MNFKRFLLIFILAIISFSTLADSLNEKRKFNIYAKISLLPKINIMEINTLLSISGGKYTYHFDIKSKNIVDFINQIDGRGKVIGEIRDSYMPKKYTYEYTRKNKKKFVEITYNNEKVDKIINIPAFDEKKLTPISKDMLLETIDPSTFFLKVLDYSEMNECKRTFHVFDGKRRYDVKFYNLKKDKEKSKVECSAKQIKLGGYKNNANDKDVFASSDYINVIYSLENKEFLGYEANNGNISIFIDEARK
tara:strand:- start:1089 stop:1835 length:747 start_codon:yes stop_codon:yes gene_type:complete